MQHELDPDRLAALEEERDFLLRSLADLEREHDAGDVDEHDYVALKDDYTVRAAATLRAIESRQATMHAVRPPRSRARVCGTVAIVAVVAISLGIFVSISAGRRGANDSATGSIGQTSRDVLLDAQSKWQSDPKGALVLYEQVLQTDPDNVEALTYRGWLLKQVADRTVNDSDRQQLVASALVSLSKAVQLQDDYVDARIFRAGLYKDEGQFQPAADDLAHVKDEDVPPFMTTLVDGLRTAVQQGLGSPAGSSVPPPATP